MVQTTCDLSNGSINLTVSGGVSPYTFQWSPGGQVTEDLSNIPAGTYDVTVTGANGCTSTASINLPNNNPTINVNGTVIANTTCNGGNGSITISVTPAGSYTFVWSNGATSQDFGGDKGVAVAIAANPAADPEEGRQSPVFFRIALVELLASSGKGNKIEKSLSALMFVQ